MLDKISDFIVFMGLPVVMLYHSVTESTFLNTAAADAQGIEYLADQVLAPVQYVLNGKIAVLKEGEYHLEQRFDYTSYFSLKMSSSLMTLPISLPLGCALKGLAYLSEESRSRREAIIEAQTSTKTHPLTSYYRKIGLAVDKDAGLLKTQGYERREADKTVLKPEKELLREVAEIFKKNEIPFWVDCGTCIGTYRYGGAIPWDNDIDIAVLLPDFDNIWHSLQALDKEKYQVQDWSNRCLPKTYIRIYIKETHNHLDLYHFAVDPGQRILKYILSNEGSEFMTEAWKLRERRYTVPSAFETIFPLRRAYFDGIEVFAPNQTRRYLQERYGENIEPARVYNAQTDAYEKDLNHPYWKIPGVDR